jgi:regulator of protease activity HflC (stomatin/prohibitin superfamily)
MKKIILVALSLNLTACGVEQVDEGFRGIKTNWGKVEGEALSPGLYFYNPFSSSIFEMSVREEKFNISTTAFTKDTQTVHVEAVVTYFPHPHNIQLLYSQFGKTWEPKIIEPAVLGSLKDSIGQYIADDLVSKREAVKQAAEKEIKSALESRSVSVTRLDLTNLDFEDLYEKAVEEKVVAIQKAAEAKNKTVQVQEEARQTVAAAQAEAESMRIRSQALSQNKNLIEYELAQKWNGVLPQITMGGSGNIPMLDLSKLK